MKVAHLADTHLGYYQYHLSERKEDFFRAFEEAVEEALSREVDFIIHSGDLFESYHPDVETLNRAVSVLRKVKEAGVPFLAITGNHDRPIRRGVCPPQELLENLGLLTLLDFNRLEKPVVLKGVYFAGVRYLPKKHLEAFLESKREELSANAEKFGLSVFLFHQAIEPLLSFEGAYELYVPQLPDGFTYYAAGHVHKPFVCRHPSSGAVVYPGATEYRSKREVKESRGFVIYDLERGEIERVELKKVRPFISSSFSEEDAPEALKELRARVENAPEPPVVLIDYLFEKVNLESFEDYLKPIREKALTVRVFKSLVEAKGGEGSVVGGKGGETVTYAEYLEAFVSNRRFHKEVLELGKELLEGKPQDVREIVLHHLKEQLGEFYPTVERRLFETP